MFSKEMMGHNHGKLFTTAGFFMEIRSFSFLCYREWDLFFLRLLETEFASLPVHFMFMLIVGQPNLKNFIDKIKFV